MINKERFKTVDGLIHCYIILLKQMNKLTYAHLKKIEPMRDEYSMLLYHMEHDDFDGDIGIALDSVREFRTGCTEVAEVQKLLTNVLTQMNILLSPNPCPHIEDDDGR